MLFYGHGFHLEHATSCGELHAARSEKYCEDDPMIIKVIHSTHIVTLRKRKMLLTSADEPKVLELLHTTSSSLVPFLLL